MCESNGVAATPVPWLPDAVRDAIAPWEPDGVAQARDHYLSVCKAMGAPIERAGDREGPEP